MLPSLLIWDFNGTLLNDTEIILHVNNRMNERRRLPNITMEYLRDHFDYPPQLFYEKVGFDLNLESYDALSKEFLDLYEEHAHEAMLSPHALDVLDWAKAHKIPQIVLSAHNQSRLLKQIEDLGIRPYFDIISGEESFVITSKVERAQNLAQTTTLDFRHAVLIGDTVHDCQTAKAIGCRCILYTKGQHSTRRLQAVCEQTIDSLSELPLLLETIKP